MLPDRFIPIYQDEHPDDWLTFLYKAAKGSVKATDTLDYASMAYMESITGDPILLETTVDDEHESILLEQFPAVCPFASVQQFHDIALDHGWIGTPFQVSETPINPDNKYVAIWGRTPVNESELMNDAMLNCLENWSVRHFLECSQDDSLEFDSKAVTSAMLYMSTTWPMA